MTKLRVLSSLALVLLPTTGLAGTLETDLIAGQHTDVGDVSISDADGVLTVTVDTSASGWELGTTHLYVGLDDPKKHAPGRFPYANANPGGATGDQYSVDLADIGATCGDTVVVALHAEVEQFLGYEDPDLDALAAALPTTAGFVADRPAGHDWFWSFSVDDPSGVLPAELDGWCVDTGRNLVSGVEHEVEVHSTLADPSTLTGLVDKPENFDQINYIINQDYRSQRCESAGRPFQVGDIQRAVWSLIDDTNHTDGLGTWSQGCQDEILADAAAHGVGFLPSCEDEVAVLMVPVDATGEIVAQVVIAEVPIADVAAVVPESSDLSCTPIVQGETGWAEGDRRFPKAWGMLIDHTTTCDDDSDDYVVLPPNGMTW